MWFVLIVIAIIIVFKVIPPILEDKKFNNLVNAAYEGDTSAIYELGRWFKFPVMHIKSKSFLRYVSSEKEKNEAREYILCGLSYKLRGMSVDLLGTENKEAVDLLAELLDTNFDKYSRSEAISATLDVVFDTNLW